MHLRQFAFRLGPLVEPVAGRITLIRRLRGKAICPTVAQRVREAMEQSFFFSETKRLCCLQKL